MIAIYKKQVFLGQCWKILGVLLCIFVIFSNAYAQKVIKGKVTDNKGEALLGVSVLLTGSSAGTTTNVDGIYELSVPSDKSVVEFSYLGYIKQSIVTTQVKYANIFRLIGKCSAIPIRNGLDIGSPM